MENLLKLKQAKNASVQLRNFRMAIMFVVCSIVLPPGSDTVRSGTTWRLLQGQTRKSVLSKILQSKTCIKKRKKKTNTFYFLLMRIKASKETG